ncbi:MazG nucleotide pyrophosphohydrolase domain-containing protein [Corynebacterium dentalis]|uniref:MazG nucleotide pyrophosphohydrolase domain-containing protein n=1 Tax=Corynebacterium dentalis TaxID=2014528 RepID=UPI0028A256D6|nr:MazG nucleotide pyrophosphohydrolase domain-containing protein [Corynebacterium dentalis]
MSVVLLDPRFPAMIPVDAVALLSSDVSYTEEVPVRVRWIIADLGGHTVDESDVLVTTDITNPDVQKLLDSGSELITAPSLMVEMEPQRQLEGTPSAASGEKSAQPGMPSESAIKGEFGKTEEKIEHSGGQVVDGEIVGTDEHTVAVAGLRRTTRTEVPASVMDEIEDAVALMARALRQGEWEQEMTHQSLLPYLREETEELAQIVQAMGSTEEAPQWLEQELCKELSDVLLQVLFHAEIANRRGAFDIGHVAGAFVAKLRSRAPYLFESVERQVPKNEQDRLWAEGKESERAERKKSLGEDYSKLVGLKDQAARDSHDAAASPAPATEAPAQPASSSTPATPRGASVLEDAELVIVEARELGYKDADIPMDVRYPMVGLEMDKPGEADRRLSDAVANFRASLKPQRG